MCVCVCARARAFFFVYPHVYATLYGALRLVSVKDKGNEIILVGRLRPGVRVSFQRSVSFVSTLWGYLELDMLSLVSFLLILEATKSLLEEAFPAVESRL